MLKHCWLRSIELVCWSLAVVCLTLFASHQYRAFAATQVAKESFSHLERKRESADQQIYVQEGQLGLLRMERIDIETAIFNGTDDAQLDLGVGRVRGTSYFELPGNVALAGHRDSFFRNLQHVAIGDEIKVESPEGSFKYEVNSFFVVEPHNVDILRDQDTDTLTLVTCYPFNYVGNAPQRFIVKATKVEQ